MAYVLDSQTGLYVDPSTGAVSSDPRGAQTVTNPSLVSQAQRNIAVSTSLLGQFGQLGQQFKTDQAGEANLSNYLNGVIAGTAPSVAEDQLQQTVGQVRQQQDSEASGATGTDAALARMNAMQNSAGADAAANQAAAGIRAQEIATATGQQSQLLANEANQAGSLAGTELSGAGQFSGQAGQEETSQAQINQQNLASQRAFESNLINAAGGGLTTLAKASGSGDDSSSGSGINPYAGTGDGTGSGTYAPVGGDSGSGGGGGGGGAGAAEASGTAGLSPTNNPFGGTSKVTGSSGDSAYTSDRREKKDIHGAAGKMQDFLDQIAAFTFEGKEGSGIPAGPRLGVMAQDLDKSALGRQVVVGGKTLKLDPANTAGAALAAVSYLNNEIKKLKGVRK